MIKPFFKSIIVSILTTEAKLVLWRYRPKIVAITGSVGKTSTKDAIYTALASFYRVRKSEKSFNSEFGVPLTILGLPNAWNNPFIWLKNILEGVLLVFPISYKLKARSFPEWLVLEVGADKPGDIESIAKWLSPDIVVLTRFAKVPVHIEFFPSRQRLIEEKGFLVKALKSSGKLVLNSDDADAVAFKHGLSQEIITYGMTGESKVIAIGEEISYENIDGVSVPVGINFVVKVGEASELVKLKGVLGFQHIYPVLAAITVGLSEGLKLADLVKTFENHIFPNGRMRLLSGIKQTTIIDDSYNSSPVAVEAALDVLNKLNHSGQKRMAILGDMLELGKHSAEAHLNVGKYLVGKVELLCVVGIRSRDIALGALQSGMPENLIFQYDSVEEASREIKNFLNPGEIVLVKGSQGARMEKIILEIMAEPGRARELLVRQEPEWQNR